MWQKYFPVAISKGKLRQSKPIPWDWLTSQFSGDKALSRLQHGSSPFGASKWAKSSISTKRTSFWFANILAVPTMVHTLPTLKTLKYDPTTGFQKWLASLSVLINQQTRTPGEIACHSVVICCLAGQFALPKWQRHYVREKGIQGNQKWTHMASKWRTCV